MATNGTFCCGRRSAKYYGVANWRCAWILLLLIIFSLPGTYDSARGITLMRQKRLDKLKRDNDFRQRITHKHGKTHCGRGLIMDPIVHVVKYAHADLWSKPVSDAESMEILVSLTSKYECRVQLATHRPTAILLVCIASSIKKSDHNDKLLSTEATLGFCLLC